MHDSLGYFEMLELMKNCQYIVTDSGGIQERLCVSIKKNSYSVIQKLS